MMYLSSSTDLEERSSTVSERLPWVVLYSYEKTGSWEKLGHSERMHLGGVEWWRGLCIPKIDIAFDAALHDT